MKIGIKIGLGFGLVLAMLATVAGYGLSALSSANETTRGITTRSVPALVALLQATEATRTMQRDWRDALLVRDPAGIAQWKKSNDTATTHLHEDIDALITHGFAEDSAKFESLKENLSAWMKLRELGISLALTKKYKESEQVLRGRDNIVARTAFELVEKQLLDEYQARILHEAALAEIQVQHARTFMWAMLVVAVLIGSAVGTFISRSITQVLSRLENGMRSLEENCVTNLTTGIGLLANGDLTFAVRPVTKPIENPANDELGSISKRFNAMLGKIQEAVESYGEARVSLSELIGQVSETAGTVSETSRTLAASSEQSGAASAEIATASERLATDATDAANVVENLVASISAVASGTESQGFAIERATAGIQDAVSAMEEVTAAAESMTATAQQGSSAVSKTVGAMSLVRAQVELSTAKVQQLDQKGQEIGAIVQAIEAIADKTNLLALNAAIEAARAGEHGRGFAVVADEVRKLADQSTNATKEIAELIAGIKSTVDETVAAIRATDAEVEKGNALSREAGDALSQIVQSAEEVAKQAQRVVTVAVDVEIAMIQVTSSAKESERETRQMAQGAEAVSAAISSVAAVSNETAAGATEMSAGIDEVSRAAAELRSMSAELQETVSKFRIAEVGSGPGPRLRVAA